MKCVRYGGGAATASGLPPELHVDDPGVAELVVEAVGGHGAERRAAEVEVVLGHRVIVHVGDDHRLRHAGAGRVVALQAPNLEKPGAIGSTDARSSS